MEQDSLQALTDTLTTAALDTVHAAEQAQAVYGWEGIAQGQGLTLMVVGLIIVFAALVLLIFMMKLSRWVHGNLHIRRMHKAGHQEVVDQLSVRSETGEAVPGVVIAAIAMTIILEEESVHDEESMVLTLRALPKPYSNWWQGQIAKHWPARTSAGRPIVMQTEDPERGMHV